MFAYTLVHRKELSMKARSAKTKSYAQRQYEKVVAKAKADGVPLGSRQGLVGMLAAVGCRMEYKKNEKITLVIF